jgi:tRNA threonylcarbamoyl adenosine modification protein YeaZ
MKTLLIDTHLWNITIILFEDGNIFRKEELKNKKNNSEYIFPIITKVLDGSDFDQVIVVNGPGSFTGVRLGVTIAKTLAYTKKIPIKTVTSLECMAISTNNKSVAFSDGNGYYIGLFDNEMNLKEDYKYVKINEINNYKDITTDVAIDYEKVYEFANKKTSINPHLVNPIYVKKIGVEQ